MEQPLMKTLLNKEIIIKIGGQLAEISHKKTLINIAESSHKSDDDKVY